jgi:glucan-binding YG repeat protein
VSCYKQHKVSHETPKDAASASTTTKETENSLSESSLQSTPNPLPTTQIQSELQWQQTETQMQSQPQSLSNSEVQTQPRQHSELHSQQSQSQSQSQSQPQESSQPRELKSSFWKHSTTYERPPHVTHFGPRTYVDSNIPEHLLTKIGQSQELVHLLQNKNLQNIILNIVHSENSVVLLRDHLENDKEFYQFIEKMLMTIGYGEYKIQQNSVQ